RPFCLSVLVHWPRRPPTGSLCPYATRFRSPAKVGAGRRTGRCSRAARNVPAPCGARFGFGRGGRFAFLPPLAAGLRTPSHGWSRSEEHTSELQSRENLVCRLLLEKTKTL